MDEIPEFTTFESAHEGGYTMRIMNRYIDRERYFSELAATAEKYYLDYIERFKTIDCNSRILEIGCGEGGNLVPFARLRCHVCGIDLSDGKIENAKKFFAARGLEGDFFCENFLTAPLRGQYDLIIIHDVIEHIEPESKQLFFAKTKELVAPQGIIFYGFPAWRMPFGGHQQICRSRICSKLPFMHLLPEALYKSSLRLFGESPECIKELLSIKRSGMTIERFESLCRSEGFTIVDRQLWLVNPHYKVKFNLTPRTLAGWLGRIPYIRNYFSTACFYILSL